MDLSFSPDQERFRQGVQKFLRENLPPGWGKGRERRPPGVSQVDFLKDWQRRLYDQGLLGMAWPKEYGGQGASTTTLQTSVSPMALGFAGNEFNRLKA